MSCHRTRTVLLSKDWFWIQTFDDHCICCAAATPVSGTRVALGLHPGTPKGVKVFFFFFFSMSWRGQRVRETVANVYNPSGKLCGSITMHRLCILYISFRHSQLHQPETHKRHGHLDYTTAIARLPNRYSWHHKSAYTHFHFCGLEHCCASPTDI